EGVILWLRGHRVILDRDLAALYGVSLSRLNEQVKRNLERFPTDFMFQLSPDERANLKAQFAISRSWGGRRTPPCAFTEQRVAMLSSVLRRTRALQVNIEIIRAFVGLRQMLGANRRAGEEARRAREEVRRTVPRGVRCHPELMAPPTRQRKRIGFRSEES